MAEEKAALSLLSRRVDQLWKSRHVKKEEYKGLLRALNRLEHHIGQHPSTQPPSATEAEVKGE